MSPDMSIDHATLEPKQPCRLLALPAELRNKIYTMAFEDEVIEDPLDKNWVEPRHFQAPPLLMTCHQIYDEARLLFYATATFRATYNADLCAWFGHIPEMSRRHIRRVQFFVSLDTWMMATQPSLGTRPLHFASGLKEMSLSKIRDALHPLNGRDVNVEINIWVNSKMEEETDPEKLRLPAYYGCWVRGEQMEDLVPVWTSDPEARVQEELEKRARLLKLLEERVEKNKKAWGEQAFL